MRLPLTKTTGASWEGVNGKPLISQETDLLGATFLSRRSELETTIFFLSARMAIVLFADEML